MGFPGGSAIEILPVMQETYLDAGLIPRWEDPLEEGMATHSSILAWRINLKDRGLAGYSLWGCKESDTSEVTEQAHTDILLRKLSSSHFTFLPKNY